MIPKMSGYRNKIDETNCMSFLIKDDELLKNIITFGIISAILLRKDLIVNQYIMKNIEKLKQNLMKEKIRFSLHLSISNIGSFCF